jgi:enoyl-CoA hydratase
MAFKHVDLTVTNQVGWLRFCRAPRNAVDWGMLYEVGKAFEKLFLDANVNVVVIASGIDGFFSTGADLSTFKQTNGTQMKEWVHETHRLAMLIRNAEKPVLAAIDGIAVGGGLEMTLHADLRFASARARLGQPEIKIAFIPPVGGTQGLVRLVGRSQAFRILYGGELMDATTALNIGLVDFVMATDQLETEVQRYGEMLAEKPSNALSAIRRCLVDGGETSFEDGMAIEKEQAEGLADHPNFQEGIVAFLEKRKPNWT